MSIFGEWRYTSDRGATIAAYSKTECGGSDTCKCDGCRNYVRARGSLFPSEFLRLLADLGIDASKEAEAYHNARISPGFHDYGGWFHFVGMLEVTDDFPSVDFGGGFSVWMCKAIAPRISALDDSPAVEVGFHSSAVPWLLDEPEPI